VLAQYQVTGDKAAQMFPEGKKTSGSEIPKSSAAMGATRVENAESLGEVQALHRTSVFVANFFVMPTDAGGHYYYSC
jgi:hypothetical protein